MTSCKKRSIKILSVLFLCIFSLALIFSIAACKEEKQTQVYGFDVTEEFTIKSGGIYAVEEPIVKDQDGNTYDVEVLVYNQYKEKVTVIGGSFPVNDLGGYTIEYRIVVDGETRVKHTKVNVTKSSIRFTVTDYKTECVSGETLTFPSVECENESVSFTYEILRYDIDPAVSVETGEYTAGKAFTLAEGTYAVQITGKLGEETQTFSYLVRAIAEKEKGLVQSFSDVAGNTASGYEIVDLQKEGVPTYSSFVSRVAKYVSTDWYVAYYANPVMDKAYYESLAAEGFDGVTVWLYMDSERAHKVYKQYTRGGYSCEDDINDAEFPAIKLQPKVWTPFHINLEETRKDFRKSFLTAFEKIDGQEFPLFWLDNYDGGSEAEITMYIGDIYVTRSKKPTLPDMSSINLGDMKTMPVEEANLEYILTDKDGATPLVGAHEFLKSGAYELTARYTTGCYFGENSVSFSVAAAHDFEFGVRQWNTDERGKSVSLSALQPTLLNKDGGAASATGYEYAVSYLGKPVALSENAFSVSRSGAYDVDVSVRYEKQGKTFTDRFTATVDIYNAADKYVFYAPQVGNAVAYKRYNWDRTPSVAIETGASVSGVSGDFLKVSTSGEDARIALKPLYSKEYYQSLYAEDESLQMILSYYVNVGGADYTHAQAFAMTETTLAKEQANVWAHKQIDFGAYLENYYDTYANQYAETSARSGIAGLFDVFTSAMRTEIYIPTVRLYAQGNGEVVQDNVVLGNSYTVAQAFETTIDGAPAEILWALIEYAGENYAIPETFKLSFGGEYTFVIAASSGNKFAEIRYEASYTDALGFTQGKAYYTNGDPVTIEDIPEFSANYTLTYVLTDNAGKTVENAVDSDGKQVSVVGFNGKGGYTLSAYASDDSATVGKKLVYVAEIDYAANAYTYNDLSAETGRNEIVLWDYYWGGHVGNKISVGTHEIGNESVYAIRAITTNYQLFNIQVKPQYGKAYYQKIADEGGVFTFRYYLTGDKDGTAIESLPVQIFGSATQTKKAFDTWHEAAIPASKIVEYYDQLVNGPKKTADVAFSSLLGVQNDVFGNIAMYLTLPEFTFEPTSSQVTVAGEEELTVNKAVDLSTLSVLIDGVQIQASDYVLTVSKNAAITYENGMLTASSACTAELTITVDYRTPEGKHYRTALTKLLTFEGGESVFDGFGSDCYDGV